MWDWIQEKKKEGLVKHAGFSFHSTPEELDEILTAHPGSGVRTAPDKLCRLGQSGGTVTGLL